MLQCFYNNLIAPRLQSRELRNREVVLNVIVVATAAIMIIATLLMLAAYIITSEPTYLVRIGAVLLALAGIVGIHALSRSGRYWIAATIVVLLYSGLTAAIMASWGTRLPAAVLLCGLIIVMSGILLSARFSLIAAVGVSAIYFIMRWAEETGKTTPNQEWIHHTATLDGAVGLLLIFCVLAVVSWLFNYRMERSLKRARWAEAALIKQKESLEDTVEERTRQLHAAQMEKMQQLYRFAELGQLSTALLHELANHMTALTLDIESLEAQNHSHLLKRSMRSIRYIDEMVQRVREQLHGQSEPKQFNIAAEIAEVVKILQHRANTASVVLVWEPPDGKRYFRYSGDPVRFRQIMANVISNAIDAYQGMHITGPKQVQVALELREADIAITVKDWGKGIPTADRTRIFEPFYSTKKTGMGMGLFITRQIIEEHFGGTVTLHSKKNRTVFTITIAKNA